MHCACVLILVVMEEGQRHSVKSYLTDSTRCLNPCCNGRGSKTPSASARRPTRASVLILVVMEEGQRQAHHATRHAENAWVLILVVMEEGQRRVKLTDLANKLITRLNPCCNGRGSKTGRVHCHNA